MLEFNEQPDGRYLPGHGGDTSNTAVAAARQGAKVGYVTHLGADAFGASFLKMWQGEGVDTSTVRQVGDAHTGIYFVTHGEEGHEFTYFRENSAASRMTPDDLPIEALQTARVLHVSGISQAISKTAAETVSAAIDVVKAAGGQVSYDTNLRLKLWPLEEARAVMHDAVQRCDIVLPGFDDAVQLCGRSTADGIADFYLELGVEVVALTLGEKGTLVATPTTRQHIPAMPVKAVDATGAGDTFDGAFLARIVEGDNAFDAARFANAAAALSVQGYGAVAPMPRRAEVEAFLAKG
ncbi:MAG: sugar kinase [Silicimonas sp.]|nr:sugar kinase [Silicimonas sp.]